MTVRRIITGVYELAREKLKDMGEVGGRQLQTREGVLKLVEALQGPCPPGGELKFLNSFIAKGTAATRTPIIKGEYRLPISMRIAKSKCSDQPVPLSMNTSGKVKP